MSRLREWLFGKHEDKAPAKKAPGMFSTHFAPAPSAIAAAREGVVKKNLQRTPDDFQHRLPDGTIAAMDATVMQYTKAAFSMGQDIGIPDAQLGWYASLGFIGYQLCAMINQNWLVDKACTMPARDAIRTGFEISVTDGKKVDPTKLDELKKLDRDMKIMDHCVQFVRLGRVFGIRHALFVVDTDNPDEYYANPFNIDAVKPGKYRGISQIDPYWVSPELDSTAAANPAAMDFYEPTWWRVNGKRVHKSHFEIFRTCEVPDLMKPTYFYGGVPLTQRIVERVYAAERTANEGPMLAMTKRLTVIQTDLEAALANQDEFDEKMRGWAHMRDNFGIKVAGEAENIQQFDTSLADLDATIMTQFQLVAAVAEVPATKLLGTTPKGFNATGEYDESNYHEMLESIQTHDLTRLVNRHHLLAIKSFVSPADPFPTEVSWNPLDTPTATERADINLKKAQTGESLVNSGAIQPEDEHNRIVNDPDSGYVSLVAFEEPPEEDVTVEDPLDPAAAEEDEVKADE